MASAPKTRRPTTRRAPARKSAPPPARPASGGARTLAWSLGGVVLAAGAGLAAFLTRGRIAALLASGEGHAPTDLAATDGPVLSKQGDERAIPAFRPDMDAPMTAAERAALAPATGPGPTLVAAAGTMNAQTVSAG